jgi:putative ribosome biogenesis GTPase RsgA
MSDTVPVCKGHECAHQAEPVSQVHQKLTESLRCTSQLVSKVQVFRSL